MALGYNLGDNPNNITLGSYDLQDEYNFNDPQPPAAFDISQGKVTVIAFAQHDDTNSLTFLNQLQSIYAANAGNNFNTVGILYEFEGSITAPEWAAALTALSSVTYDLLNNGTWGTGTPATDYLTNYGAAVASPVVYIISKYYTIAYKTQLSVHADVAAMIAAIDSTVSGLLAGPTITIPNPTGTTTLATLDGLTIEFSEVVSNSDNTANYEIVTGSSPGQGTLSNNPNTATPGSTDEDVTLDWIDTQEPVDGDILLRVNISTGAGSRITDSVFYTPVPMAQTDLSFTIETATADLHIRDNLSDDGTGPSPLPLWKSPDIIPSTTEISDPQTYYTELANVDRDDWEYYLDVNQPVYIYIRAKNIGGAPADNTVAPLLSATVYYADLTASAILPDDWTEIGAATFPDASYPNDGNIFVSNALQWIPPLVGHYCLIATIGNSQDIKVTKEDLEAAVPPIIDSVATYLDYIRNQNNYAYRNIQVQGTPPPPPMVLSINSPAEGASVNGNALISFTNSNPNNPMVSVDNANWTDAVSGITRLSDIPQFAGLPEAGFVLYLRDIDTGGITRIDSVNLSKDTVMPDLAITSPLDGATVNGDVVIVFTNSEPHNPKVSVDNTNWTDAVSGSTKLSDIPQFAGLPESAFVLYLRDTDNAGNTGTDSINVVKDTTRPAVSITSPAEGATVNGNAVISFTDSEPHNPKVSIDNTNWTDAVSGTTRLSDIPQFADLSETGFILYLTETDSAGNTGTDSVNLTKVAIPPPNEPKGFFPLPFIFTGGGKKDKDITFQLEIVAMLAARSRIILEMPVKMFKYIKENNSRELKIAREDRKNEVVWIHINPHKKNIFKDVYLPPGFKAKMRLFVHIPEKLKMNNYTIFARQLYEDMEIGRVTWYLGPRRRMRKPCFIMRFFRFLFRILFKRTRKRVV